MLVVAAVLGACGGSDSSDSSGEVYRVRVITGLTGETEATQKAVLTGASAAAAEINADGGILGRKIEISTCDTGNDPGKAASCAQSAVSRSPLPDMIYAGGGSSNTLAELPIITPAKILSIEPLLAPGAEDPEKYPYNFSETLSVTAGATAFADYAKNKGYKKVAVAYSNDAYGEATGTTYAAELQAAGVEAVSSSYDQTAVDVTGPLLKLKNAAPDALLAVGFGTPAGHVLTSLQKIDWRTPVVGDLGFSNTNLFAIAPPATLENLQVQVFATQAWVPPDQRSAPVKALLKYIEDHDGEASQSLGGYGYGWDALQIAKLGTEKAGSTDVEKVTDAIERLGDQEPSPFIALDQYGYSPQSHQPAGQPSDYTIVPYTKIVDGMIGKQM